jgi:hypothetical protein
MRLTLFILLILIVNISSCQSVNCDKRVVEEVSSISVLEAPFMINEIIEIYKKDSLIVTKAFNREIFNRTDYTIFCYNVCTDFFYKELQKSRNSENKLIIDRILGNLNYKGDLTKPKINWARVFETCQSCPFGEYPDEMIFYFKFSLLFMGEDEIVAMTKDEDGKQWKYVLEDIRYGDVFTLDKEDNYKQYVLDRRMASYIIERWKNSNIKEIQDLIAVYKSVM